MNIKFKDKVVIVTGASSGIGEELAVQLSLQTSNVVIVARNASQLDRVASRCRENGADPVVIQADVSTKLGCEDIISQCVEKFGRLDALFCNAGQAMQGEFLKATSPDAALDLMRVNYDSLVYLSYTALPHLIKAHGSLIVVAGLVGHVGVPGYTAYSASKHAVVGFARALRRELSSENIRITLISPDTVKTSIRANMWNTSGESSPEKYGDEKVQLASECATQIIEATTKDQSELLLGRIKLLQRLQSFLPSVIDKILTKKSTS